jgi:dolichol kinase
MGKIKIDDSINKLVDGRSWRESVEWKRKAIHLLGCLLALWVLSLDEPEATSGLFLMAFVIIVIDYARLKDKRWAAQIYKLFPMVFRNEEKNALTGSSAMIAGAAITSLLFDSGPAFAGIMCLSLGDSSAAIVGQAYSFRRQQLGLEASDGTSTPVVNKRKGKTVAGSMACLIVSALIVFLFITKDFSIVLLASGAATAMERWTPGRWDNVTIPLVTAGVLQFLVNWS